MFILYHVGGATRVCVRSPISLFGFVAIVYSVGPSVGSATVAPI